MDMDFDIDSDWILIIMSPIIIIFIYPFVFMAALYSCAVFLRVYRRKRRAIFDAYTENFWDGAKQAVAAFVDAHGEYWHGYEIIGMDKLPAQGPGLLIYYHGALPVDMYYIMARIYLEKKRRLRNVVATFLFHIPGFQIALEVFGAVEGRTREQCVEILKNGELLAISPGGVREALFSDEYYGMIWNSRKGFAKVAMTAGVPIYPVFTQNVRESFRSIKMGQGFFRKLYEWTKLPLVPLYGGFPVKMRTIIGDPIPHDPSKTHEELTFEVQSAIQKLIKKHQRIPGSIMLALKDRWTYRKRRSSSKEKEQ